MATTKAQYSHDLIAERALAWVEQQQGRPFFLYLALTTPHANNEAKTKGMEVPDYGPYADLNWPEPQKGHAAMITRMDADIGRLLAKLEQLGVAENTLILFSSDNGPHAEGGNDPKYNDSNGPLKGLKRDLTDGGIRVPLIARWPGKIAEDKTSGHVGYFADLMPTLAELTDTTDEAPDDIDGISFLPTLLGEGERQRQHDYLYWAFYERGGGGQAARMGKWKAIQQPINTAVRLYDVAADIGEERNVAAEHPGALARAIAAMKEAYHPSKEWKFPAGGGR